MSRREIWWTGGQATDEMTTAVLFPRSELRKYQAGIVGLISTFGALGDAAVEAGMKFEDAANALRYLAEQYPGALVEPKECVFCGAAEAERRKHAFDTFFMNGISIWTRVCARCSREPLCPQTSTGVHLPVAASDKQFQLKFTVVVDLKDLDRCGHCGDCGLPLVLRDEGWRHWSIAERAKLL